MANHLPKDLLDILICPDSRADLIVDAGGDLVSVDADCRRRYRVEDGIPNMLIEDSQVLSAEEHEAALAWAREHLDAQSAPTRKALASA